MKSYWVRLFSGGAVVRRAVVVARRGGVVGVLVLLGAVGLWASPVFGQSAAAPVITSVGPFMVDEGTIAVATLAATDSDTLAADLTWTMAGGADAALFVLSESGVLAFGSVKDFEEPDDGDGDGTYEVTVQVSDGVSDVAADVLVMVGNVVELEAIAGPEAVTFAENSWSRVATFSASSAQDRDAIVWTLGGSDAAHFSIDDPPGVLRFDLVRVAPAIFSKPPDFEAPVDSVADNTDNTYVVTLLPRAGSVTADSPLTVTVAVTDADEDGTVSLSTKRPRTGVAVTAVLADPDTVVDGSQMWKWERLAGRYEWVVIAGADSATYTPVAVDAGRFLRVSATYSDRHGGGAQAVATAPEVVAAAQLSSLSISTNDSVASGEWRQMRPAFDAETLHYSVGCNRTDTMTLTLSAADASSRVSVDGAQYANPGAGTSVTATRAVSGDSVVRVSLADSEGAQTQYVVHCLPDAFGEVTTEKPLGEAKVLDELILFPYAERVVIMDSNGVPRVQRSVTTGGRFYFRFYPDGGDGRHRYSYTTNLAVAFVLDENLDEIAVARTVAPLTRQDSHDFRVLENGNYMLMAYQDTERDLSHLTFTDRNGQPYGADVYVEDSVIQIVDPNRGVATFNWNSWDHMPLEDCVQHFFPPRDGDYAHLNATQMVDGLIVVSMRGCSRVLGIDAATGDVLWRVGLSNLSDAEWAERGIGPPPLDIVGDPEGHFCGEHASSLLPNGNLILYDNGAQCPIDPWTRQNLLRENEEFSRGLEYALDLDNGEAVFVRDHSLHGTRTELGYRGGNIESLRNGHWLISWGNSRPRNVQNDPPSKVMTQVDPDTGEEWLHLGGSGAGVGDLRGAVMPPEALAQDPVPLVASFPASEHTSAFHSGFGDAPQMVVAFNRPVVDFSASSPSLNVSGATVTSVAPHLVSGEAANAYLVTLAPVGAGRISVTVNTGRACGDGGVCTVDGTVVSAVQGSLVIRAPVAVSFGAAAYSVREGAALEVPVVLDRPYGGRQQAEVPVVASGVSASGDDFSVTESVVFDPGNTRRTVLFSAAADDLVEGSETVELRFSALPPGFSAGSTAETTVTIADADAAVIDFSVASGEVAEGGETVLTFAISNGVVFAEDQTIDIDVSGSAAAGDDFVLTDSQNRPLSAPYSVTLAAGASEATAALRAVDDFDPELAETVTFDARLASTNTLIGSRTVTIAASDLDAPEVTITQNEAVAEGDDAVFTLRRTATLDSPLTRALSVRVAVTAAGGVLSGAPPSTVRFPAGDSTVELRAGTVDDFVVEDAATVTALVRADTSSPARYLAGSPNSATVTVRDDDVAGFSVFAAAAEVLEGAAVAVTVHTGGVTFAVSQSLWVSVAGSATPVDDFVLRDSNGAELVAPYELTLAAGAGSVGFGVAAALDAVEDDAETVVVSVRHGVVLAGSAEVTIVDPNEAPVVDGGGEFFYAENGVAAVGGFSASDSEGDAVSWSLAGADAARFRVTGGELRFAAPPDFEMPGDSGGDNVYDVIVEASDDGGVGRHPVTVAVTDVDETVVITSDTGSFVVVFDENSTADVGAYTATDPERAAIRWSLDGDDSRAFEISDRGVLRFVRPPDYEHPVDDNGDSEYRVQMRARAGADAVVVQGVVVNVVNVDEDGAVVLSSPQPQIGTPLRAAVADPDDGVSVLSSPQPQIGTLLRAAVADPDDGVSVLSSPQPQIGTLLRAAVADPDRGVSVLSWVWQRSQGGVWEDIAGAVSDAYTPAPADEGHNLRVEATYLDGSGSGTNSAAVHASYATRAAPSTANSAPDFGEDPLARFVAESSPTAAIAGAPASDPDPGDRAKLAYTLSGPDADLFTIDGAAGQIRVGSGTVLDYETPPRSYSVTVAAADPSGARDDITVTIEVTDVNEAPLAREDTAAAVEDTAVVIAVLANDTDPDSDTLTAAVRDAPLHGRVTPQADKTLLYTPNGDFNGNDIFTYTATDGRLTNETTVIVTVAEVNDQPKFPAPSVTRHIAHGAEAGTPVGAPVNATDIDGDALTYRLFDVDAHLFTIESATGQITVGPQTVIDRQTQPTYRLRVDATDPHGARVSIFVTVTVTTTATGEGAGGAGGGGAGGGGGGAGGGPDGSQQPAPAGFTDVNPDSSHAAGIDTLAAAGITVGCSTEPLRYCPHNPVTRAQMATFLTRALGLAPAEPAGFADVDPNSTHAAGIDALAAAGITVGCSTEPLRYCPHSPVTRAQMATFLTRALGLAPAEPAGFADVDPGSTHAAGIDALAAAGITVGCSTEPLRYCPDSPVTRAQMATFLTRALDLALSYS